MATGIIAYLHYDFLHDYANYVVIFNMDGEFIRTVKYSNSSYAGYGDTVVVDANNDIFISGRWTDKILKLNSAGAQLLEVNANTPMVLALAPDGSVWDLEYDDGGNPIFIKRNASTLAVEDSFNPTGGDYQGMAFDPNGYLYSIDWVNKNIEKWNVVTHTRIAIRALSGDVLEKSAVYSSLTIMGSNVTLVNWALSGIGYDYFLCPTDLSSDFVTYTLAEFPGKYWTEVVSTYNKDNYILCGDVDVNEPEIEKGQTIIRYDSSFNVVWQIFYDGIDGGLSVSAYPFEVAEVYDYPLAPIMFPAKQRGTSLKEDCRNFEESISDVCLVFNNNVKVTRLYLQETYGDITHPESSNLREILSSQQLVKILGEDVDYKAIIDNFITNISSMFTLINQNNTLVKGWLDDYEPDEAGHEFTDVKMKPIVVNEDLSKTMDELFEGIIDNVTILNMNLEVLKERF